jgi:hypothetical protein
MRKDEECPVCLKDKKIEELELSGEYLVLYLIMCIDTLRIMSVYDGDDREQIKKGKEKVNSELKSSNREGNHSLKILRNEEDISLEGLVRPKFW